MSMMKRWAKWTGSVAVVICLATFGAVWQKRQVKTLRHEVPSTIAPVFLVPGSSAGQNRFDPLIRRLNRGRQPHSVLKVKVGKDDHLTYTGRIRKGDRHPFIVVAFSNNRDGYANIKQQARWFSIAFRALMKLYHFNHFSAVGHSNGGIVLTLFLERYLPAHVTAERLLTIASPYNLERRTAKQTQMLRDLIRERKQLPTTLKVYSIAGTQNYSGDGTVPFMSVDSGKYVFQNQVASYTEIVVTGVATNHHQLPQNRQIINLINQYVLHENISDTVKRQNKLLPRIK